QEHHQGIAGEILMSATRTPGSELVVEPVVQESGVLPYGFARRHGVLLRRHEGRTELCYRKPLSLPVVAEVRRHFRFAGKPVELDEAAFNTALALAYESQRRPPAAGADD